MDLFISFPSGCLHTKSSSLSHFLSSSLPPVSLSLQLCALASCFKGWNPNAVLTKAVVPQRSERSNIGEKPPSVQIFVFHSTWNTYQLYFPFFSFFENRILVCSHKVCSGNVMQHKQNSPEFSSGPFNAPPSLTKLCPKFCLSLLFSLLLFPSFSPGLHLFFLFLFSLSVSGSRFPVLVFPSWVWVVVKLTTCLFVMTLIHPHRSCLTLRLQS